MFLQTSASCLSIQIAFIHIFAHLLFKLLQFSSHADSCSFKFRVPSVQLVHSHWRTSLRDWWCLDQAHFLGSLVFLFWERIWYFKVNLLVMCLMWVSRTPTVKKFAVTLSWLVSVQSGRIYMSVLQILDVDFWLEIIVLVVTSGY